MHFVAVAVGVIFVAAPRILIVEDEMLIAMMIEDFLTDLGWDVVGIAVTADRALAMARDAAIDAALLDVNLNGQNTFAAAEMLRTRRIPFVFATGYGANGVADRFPAVPTLTKPFQYEDLDRALRRATAEARGCSEGRLPT